MDVETNAEVGPGEAYVIPLGHDAWVVGDEPVVSVDMTSITAERYVKGRYGREHSYRSQGIAASVLLFALIHPSA